MVDESVRKFLNDVLVNMPEEWLKLTTHRLDIYNEPLAKVEFIEHFEKLYREGNFSAEALNQLPTAFDYIRLGHPLSCVLEWVIAQTYQLEAENVISFSSRITPILAVLRTNLLEKKKTRIVYSDKLPHQFDIDKIRDVYGYHLELYKIEKDEELPPFDGSTIYVVNESNIGELSLKPSIDFYVNIFSDLGSIIIVNGEMNAPYIPAIQHVRRRESIAMTPKNCQVVLEQLLNAKKSHGTNDRALNKAAVIQTIKEITGADTQAVIGSSGLSIQYGITMGLIDYAQEHYAGHDIKIIIPPNCYGGTNDQARRVAACLDHVEVMDLPVDGDHNMVESIDLVLDQVAQKDAIPLIIVEIPTNPRVEVPDLLALKEALSKSRKTSTGNDAIEPVFILDQTFCPNVHFLGDLDILANIQTISYVSGSKFPSGGLCTAGYCLANKKADHLMPKIDAHLKLCDNEATDLQVEILAKQMPSMLSRIEGAYQNTRTFVNFIEAQLPNAKINFVSEELAQQGFTPSVFSLDLPTQGDTHEERETYKRRLNHKLIKMMITQIPNESKHCVSYGQLKGCYWTIPATSTQGTTKEKDKDYIARVSCSPNMNIEKHKQVFLEFVEAIQKEKDGVEAL